MQKASCGTCGTEQSVGEMLALENKAICIPCAEKRAAEAKGGAQSLGFSRIIDSTICNMCKTDYGSSALPFVGGMPVCGNCSKGLYERAYPTWLKLTMAGLLLLLVAALWRGAPYFNAGRHLVLAERAMDRNDYQKARAEFAEVMKVSPQAQKVVLMGAKANLMAGDVEGAQKFLKLRETYEQNELFAEVNGKWNRAVDALNKAVAASKLVDAHNDEEAARLMHQASAEYPESHNLSAAALGLDAGVAFDRKDYDGFVRLSRAAVAEWPNEPDPLAELSSALACKYAVTGNPEFRKESEATLEKAWQLAQASPDAKARVDEYAERIRYRLDSREIIDKDEYDHRFRQKEAQR